ncbi:hypothetical protein BCONGLO52_30790 [Brachybacterium conglomeratum]|uniref:Uncharacterized protein n=1 Tax=Brachybacterium conglomeratum TaxID=47846 RepID=A0ABQ5RK36_9MICO|nr:hypothetical protein BCONGLO52_30790 [Brachybacterium conglomeratum]GLK03772.1 hypothetical protein GCM10017597_05710 [Brachybacterium conglomeratum]
MSLWTMRGPSVIGSGYVPAGPGRGDVRGASPGRHVHEPALPGRGAGSDAGCGGAGIRRAGTACAR